MRIKLSQLRHIIREEAARAIAEEIDPKKTLYGGGGAEEERNAALEKAGIKPPKTSQSGVPLAPARKYPASQPRRDNPLMRTTFGNKDDEAKRNVALNAARLKKGDAELDEMTESILRAVISRASRRR